MTSIMNPTSISFPIISKPIDILLYVVASLEHAAAPKGLIAINRRKISLKDRLPEATACRGKIIAIDALITHFPWLGRSNAPHTCGFAVK